MGVQIDETRGDDTSAGVDDTSAVCVREVTNLRNAICLNANIAALTGPARAVDDRAVANNGVKHEKCLPSESHTSKQPGFAGNRAAEWRTNGSYCGSFSES